ncbi:MAG: mechanosensitive ion channel family protein [Calditrichaceae bacterium]
MEFLDKVFYQNPVKMWLIAAGILIFSFILFKIIISFIKSRLKKIKRKSITPISDVVLLLLEKTSSLLLIFISLFLATLALTIKHSISDIILKGLILVFLIQIAIWGTALITHYIREFSNKKRETDAAAVTTMSALSFVGKLILYILLVIVALDNLGFNITTLVAGLGVGGIAIALAVQSILSDLFASLSIVLDKPFVIGDFIIVNEYLGTVEHIGLKTTRIRSLGGEQLIFSNNDLLNSRIRNYKRMEERRIVFKLGVIYQTSREKLEIIPGIIKEIIENQEIVRFDRSHFQGFGDFSLNFETVYWVKSPDYNKYMDIQQQINLNLVKKFKEEGIEFAYPTQLVYVDKSD